MIERKLKHWSPKPSEHMVSAAIKDLRYKLTTLKDLTPKEHDPNGGIIPSIDHALHLLENKEKALVFFGPSLIVQASAPSSNKYTLAHEGDRYSVIRFNRNVELQENSRLHFFSELASTLNALHMSKDELEKAGLSDIDHETLLSNLELNPQELVNILHYVFTGDPLIEHTALVSRSLNATAKGELSKRYTELLGEAKSSKDHPWNPLLKALKLI